MRLAVSGGLMVKYYGKLTSASGEIGIHVCLRSICLSACWFKSSLAHHLKTSLLIQSDVRKTSELSGVFLYPCTNFGLQSHISTLEIYKTPLS